MFIGTFSHHYIGTIGSKTIQNTIQRMFFACKWEWVNKILQINKSTHLFLHNYKHFQWKNRIQVEISTISLTYRLMAMMKPIHWDNLIYDKDRKLMINKIWSNFNFTDLVLMNDNALIAGCIQFLLNKSKRLIRSCKCS